jgi:arsenate reductase
MELVQARTAKMSGDGSVVGYQPSSRRAPKPYNVLFLCVDNAICSIMAEAVLRRWGGDSFQAFSAGVEPRNETPRLVADLLKEHRVWHDGLFSKGCHAFLAPHSPLMDFIISLGNRPPIGLPTVWPGAPKLIHWHITEPLVNGSDAEKAASLRRTFVEIETRVRLFVLVYQKEAARSIGRAA